MFVIKEVGSTIGKLKHFDKIKRIGHDRTQRLTEGEGQLHFKEKLDGANFRAKVIETEDGYKWMFGSRNVEYKINGEPDYSENVDGRFTDAIEHIREKIDPEWVAENIGTQYTYFAENMVKHSLEYDWDNTPQLIGFDIYDHEKEEYLPTETSYAHFESLGIETAPIVNTTTVQEFNPSEYEIPESNFREGKMEGVVIIREDKEEDDLKGFSTRAKMVTEEFAEKHKEATGANQSKEAVHGHEKIVSKYCTDARIEKHVYKMLDEGRDLGLELMGSKEGSKGLPMRVSTDIIEEEAADIVRRNDVMKWKEYRTLVAKRCKHQIEQMMQRKAGGEEIG